MDKEGTSENKRKPLSDTVKPEPIGDGELTHELDGGVIRTIGKYQLSGRIGLGTMGEVWKGVHPTLQVPVAVKVLSASFVKQNPDYEERFLNEARLAAQLAHPHMVTIFDADIAEGESFLVMELMVGGTVGRRIRADSQPIPEAEAITIVNQIGGALAAAHALNIIHRDIKPDNLMIDAKGRVKLADLGLAKELNKNSNITAAGTGLGTPLYMSPEQAMDARLVDPRSDIYSLGATMYHMVTGQPPYKGSHLLEVVNQHINAEPPDPREHVAGLSAGLASVIMRMMAKSPDDRYQSVDEVLADLNRVGAGVAPAPLAAPGPQGGVTISKGQWKFIIGALILLLILLIAMTLTIAMMLTK